MKTPAFEELPQDEQDWIDAYLDGTIEPADFEALQDRMLKSSELRLVMRRYLALDNSLQNEGESELEKSSDATMSPWLVEDSRKLSKDSSDKIISFPNFRVIALVASVAFLLGLGFMQWGDTSPSVETAEVARDAATESTAEGFAVLGSVFDVEWPAGETPRREGDTLGSEVVRLAAGTAEIQFFSGAMMTVEGPAEIVLKSAWEASCKEGTLRMRVPPAARGFKLHAPSTEIIDLGTEFGLQVRDGKGHVEVFDGEIAVRHRGEDEMRVEKGDAFGLEPDAPSSAVLAGQVAFPNVQNFGVRAVEQRRVDFDLWKQHRDALAKDDRLIAYYTFDRHEQGALIPNLAVPRNPELDGAVVLAESVNGRWAGMKSALEFRRPGSRVRVNIPGEFSAFSFVCWVRIDSLDRWYNALFMGDGYETGEPHWQIRDDGKLMLSVMVDHLRRHPKNNESRFHHVYFSPVIWDLSMSGQWLHIASVFDPEKKQVSHYVNGERVSREVILPEFMIEKLRIGNGEIGNWGQPFREDPTFTIRNLNGRMDEFALFREALSDEEIATLFASSRSGRR